MERLNASPHLEKIHYFMSKADAVDKEHDRQRVLIQITQNLGEHDMQRLHTHVPRTSPGTADATCGCICVAVAVCPEAPTLLSGSQVLWLGWHTHLQASGPLTPRPHCPLARPPPLPCPAATRIRNSHAFK